MVNKSKDIKAVDLNVDDAVVSDFGSEWKEFDQRILSDGERERHFNIYFSIFPWDRISSDAHGFDAGCGSGRWAVLVAPRVGHLYCVDPSDAIEVAKESLRGQNNCSFHRNTVGDMPFPDESMDFGYSLGVLHHIPDTQKGMDDCVRKLKVGAPFLVYLYYAFDNQPKWFRWVWKVSDILRRVTSRLPQKYKYIVSQIIAVCIYFPLARTALLIEKAGGSVHSWPLSTYRNRSFYSMRTDALDRFGTKLESRFTKVEIQNMMERAGLERIQFNTQRPFYCAVGYKK